MFLMDVNVLVYAHREDAANHSAYRQWLESVINGPASFGYSELVLSGFLRVVTHPKVFEMPSTLSSAIRFTQQIKRCKVDYYRVDSPLGNPPQLRQTVIGVVR